jgi:hypothetical protein
LIPYDLFCSHSYGVGIEKVRLAKQQMDALRTHMFRLGIAAMFHNLMRPFDGPGPVDLHLCRFNAELTQAPC